MRKIKMKTEDFFGLTVIEKFSGIILMIIGALSIYFTFTSTREISNYSSLFGILGLILLIAGLLLLIVKSE